MTYTKLINILKDISSVLIEIMAIITLMKEDEMIFNIMHTSERFSLSGNQFNKLTLSDKGENKSYEIKHGDLVRFREQWYKIAYNKRDIYLITVVAFKTRRSVKEVAKI